jgi:hypothetical protein
VIRSRGNCRRISIYTIENGGQQTVINYNTTSPQTIIKEELPPAYSEAIKMQVLQMPTMPSTTLQSTSQRRNSATV